MGRADAVLTRRQKGEVVDLFDQLGISLIGDGVSAADVYTAVLQPCFGMPSYDHASGMMSTNRNTCLSGCLIYPPHTKLYCIAFAGARLPSLMQPLAESCGQAEESLSLPSLGPPATESFAKHSHHSECCDSVSPSDMSTGNVRCNFPQICCNSLKRYRGYFFCKPDFCEFGSKPCTANSLVLAMPVGI